MSSIPLGPEQEAQVQASADKIQDARRPPVEKLARPPLAAEEGRPRSSRPLFPTASRIAITGKAVPPPEVLHP